MGRIIDFEKGRMKYGNKERNIMSTYEKGTFEVIEVNKDGCLVLKLLRNGKTFKILLNKKQIKEYSVGQRIGLMISKKLFYVYWEIEYFDNIFIE